MGNLDLFDIDLVGGRKKIAVLPCSVIEIGEQPSIRREDGGHDSKSSRAEYSHFPAEVGAICFQLYLSDKCNIFDPFAGWGERAADAREHWKSYTGFDINPLAIARAKEVFGVENTLADSRINPIPNFDGLITCPPYWNLEKYSDSGLDGLPTFDKFCDELGYVFRRCYDAAERGAIFCVMTGDWRDGGKYFDLTYRVQNLFDKFGASVVDQVVLSRLRVSKVKVMIPQAIRLGYTVKVHETLSVFKKTEEISLS